MSEAVDRASVAAFLEAVDRKCGGLTVAVGASPGCGECGLEAVAGAYDVDLEAARAAADEGSFRWYCECDSCGSTMGGQRYPAHFILPSGDVSHGNVCVDCLMFHANGDVPESWQ